MANNIENFFELNESGFELTKINSASELKKNHNNTDYFQITMIEGKSVISICDKIYNTEGTTLIFNSNFLPLTSIVLDDNNHGYSIIFTPEFLKKIYTKRDLYQSPLFQVDGNSIFNLTVGQKDIIEKIFLQMLSETATDENYMANIRNDIELILSEALELQPLLYFNNFQNSSYRLTSLFLKLLEQQFSLLSPKEPLQLRSAFQFANTLGIHVNHLNRLIKSTIGITTTEVILCRIINEAKLLLLSTSWTISEIAFSLGYSSPTYFHNSFKKHTGNSPSDFRCQWAIYQ